MRNSIIQIRITFATIATICANNAATSPQSPDMYHLDPVLATRACAIAKVIQNYKPMPDDELQTALCIAYYESRFKTTAVAENRDKEGNLLSSDWGLFQINDKWQLPDKKKSNCYAMHQHVRLRTDLATNARCAAEIYEITGDFTPWTTWRVYCSKSNYRQLVVCDSPGQQYASAN